MIVTRKVDFRLYQSGVMLMRYKCDSLYVETRTIRIYNPIHGDCYYR